MDEIIEKFLTALDEHNKSYEKAIAPYIQLLQNSLQLQENEVRKIVYHLYKNDKSILLKMDENSIVSLVSYLIDIFGSVSSLTKFLSAQETIDIGFDTYTRKYTLLNISPKEQIGKQIDYLKTLFSLTNEQCIDLICANPSWFYHTEIYFEKRISLLSNFWGLDRNAVINLCYNYPFVLGKRLNNVQNRIDDIQHYYSIPEKKIKALMIAHPKFMNWGIKSFVTAKVPIELFDNYWLMNCITSIENMNYAGYRNYQNLCAVLRFIQNTFGTIEKIINRKYKEGRLIAVLTHKENAYFIVTLGGNLISEYERKSQSKTVELLLKIFANNPPSNDAEYFFHKEYFCKINAIDDDFDNALDLLFIAGLYRKKHYSLKDTSQLYKLSDKNYFHSDIENLVKNEIICENIDISFCAPIFKEKGVLTVLSPKTDNVSDVFPDEELNLDDLFDDFDTTDE